MPNKGITALCFHPKTLWFSVYRNMMNSPAGAYPSQLTSPHSFSESVMDKIIETATVMITNWNPDSSTFAEVTSLFYENKREAMQFLKCVNDLQKAMQLLVEEDSASEKLIQAQNLMQIAMKRLQKEFYQILSISRAHLDPESVSARSSRTSVRSSLSDYEYDGSRDQDNDVRAAGDSISEIEEVSSITMANLKSIADCMISAGYAKECIRIYKSIRKSIIDEGIYRLGIERVSSSQINKLDWEILDFKIKNWLKAVKIAMRTLFTGERILCDQVFGSSDSIKESCFSDISKEGATLLFGFPDLVAKSKKSHSDKMFRVLDMYTSITENWPDIASIFSFESTSTIRSQALNSLAKLADLVRQMTSEFESHIQKESSKVQVPGGGVHPLTIYTMNYLCLLSEYDNILGDVFAHWSPPSKFSLPESYFDCPDTTDTPSPAVNLHVAWLILVLLCKFDGKAKYYKVVSLSYLFLANNLLHILSKVRTSNLRFLLGEEWIKKHEAKVNQFAANFVRVAWDPVVKSLPENQTAVISPGQAKDYFKSFESSFEQVYEQHSSYIVPDPKLREEIKVLISEKLVAVYREFYNKHKITVGERKVRLYVRFAPEDVDYFLSELFFGTSSDESVSGRRASSSSTSRFIGSICD